MAAHSSVLAWTIPGAEEPGGLPSMGSHRVGHGWSDLASSSSSNVHERSNDSVSLPAFCLITNFLLILIGAFWYLVMALICISIKAKDAEHFFACFVIVYALKWNVCSSFSKLKYSWFTVSVSGRQQWFSIFIACTPFKVVIKYWPYPLLCAIYPCTLFYA